MMRFLFSIFLVFCLCGFSTAQTQSLLFEKTWGEDYGDGISYADELPNGDFLLIGGKALTRWGNVRAPGQEYACRMTANGTILWEKDWGNIYENDAVDKIIKCHDGTYMIAGTGLSGSGGGIGDFTACNIDVDGNILFYRFYNFYYDDKANDMIETYDGGFVICGTSDIVPGNGYPTLLKIDRFGNELWRRRQTNLGGVPCYIQQTPDSGFVVLAAAAAHNNCYYAKYKSDGIMDWVKYPFGLADTIPNLPLVLRTNKDGTFDIYYGTNYPIFPMATEYVFTLYKHYDSSGNCLSTKTYSEGVGYLFLNPSDSAIWAIHNDFWLSKLGNDGVFKPIAGLGSLDASTKEIFSYIQTSDGGYLAVGYDDENRDAFSQFYIVKFSSDGRYAANDFSDSVSVYPNPSADGNVTLTFDVTKDDDVQVDIYAADGKRVYTNSIFCPANSHTELRVRLDEISANGGMYILQARTSDAVIRKKLVIQRNN